MGLVTHLVYNQRFALAAMIVAAALAFVLTQPHIAPAGPAALIVNSTANTSDGSCNVANCTLREAIDAVNTGPADIMEFDLAVFPPATPGVIDIEGGLGPLPPITANVTIEAGNAGVVIDGDGNDDGTAVGPGLAVNGSHTGFTFELFGEGHFTIQDIAGRGIDVLGQGFVMDTLTVNAVAITGTTGDGITVTATPYVSFISLTGSTIESGNNGIRAVMAGPNIQDVSYVVTGNDIEAANADASGAAAVTFNMQAGLATNASVDFTVDDNTLIRSHGDNGVNLVYCTSGTPCALDHGQINASISGNTAVQSSGDGVHVRLNADPDAPGSVGSSISLHVDDNDEIIADSDAIDIVSRLCCGSDNQQTITVDGNGPITTVPDGSDAIDIEAGACCNPASGVAVDISDNAGISANEGNAVQLFLVCCGDNNVDILDNTTVSSANDNGMYILSCVEDALDPQGDEADCVADTTTLLNITGNTLTSSAEDGIHICCGEFQRGAERSVISANTVTDNQRDGIEIESSHGITVGPGNVITGNGTSGDGDNNGIEIGNMGSLLIFDRFHVEVPASTNTITQNQIFANAGLGIDLVGFSKAANPEIPDEVGLEYTIVGCNAFPLSPISPNNCLPSSVLSGVASDALEGEACAGCLIEVFLANDQPPDQTGPTNVQYGEGASYLASGVAAGDGGFSIELPCGLSAGELTATATDENGNTSEFSANLAFGGTTGVGCTPTPGGPSATPSQTPPPTTSTPAPPTATATPPGATMTPTATIEPLLCGDVDGSGSVNSIDAAIVLQYSAGLIQTLIEPQGADVNGDGNINSIDAALILQNTAGLLDTLVC